MRHPITRPLAAAAILAAIFAIAACGEDPAPAPRAEMAPPPARRCDDRPGSITDLSDGGWRSASGRRWTTTAGCYVRNDVVADLDGLAHCGWETARLIVVSEPVGRRIRGRGSSRTYVRDPENAFDDAPTAARLDVDAVLPATATFTGLRYGSTELWAIPGDPAWIYLRGEDAVERWPLDRDVPGCA